VRSAGILAICAILTWAVAEWHSLEQRQIELKRQLLEQTQLETQADLGFIQFFYWELVSTDRQRRTNALTLIKSLRPAIRPKLLPLMRMVDPRGARAEAIKLADDRNLPRPERQESERLQRQFSRELAIASPADGSEVDRSAKVTGFSPFPNDNHFLVVTPENGTQFLQDVPMDLDNGMLRGNATFGSAAVGAGQHFKLYLLATQVPVNEVIAAWPLQPADAIVSEEITVLRRRNSTN
jgi:hypothetical protein